MNSSIASQMDNTSNATVLTTANPGQSPELENVIITYNILPTAVTLSLFTGGSDSESVQLNWETAGEMALVGFNVNRTDSVLGEISV